VEAAMSHLPSNLRARPVDMAGLEDLPMSGGTLLLGIALSHSPAEVFGVLTDGAVHSRLTGAVSTVDPKPGGRFSYFDGVVSGVFEEIRSPILIRHSLRAADWPEGEMATVVQEFIPQADGKRTFVEIRVDDLPRKHLDAAIAKCAEYGEKLADYLRERRVDVVTRFVEEYKNRHRWDAVDEYVAEDCKIHIPLPGLSEGREGLRLNGRLMCTAFPDVRVTREFFVTEGDVVVERASAKATHQGELMGLPASGKSVTWTELHAYRVEGSLITEVWSEADFMGVMAQLGAVEFPGGDTP
jgi:predicted ester cyclase/uncharacterized protein YndB with AHSA1/START domain